MNTGGICATEDAVLPQSQPAKPQTNLRRGTLGAYMMVGVATQIFVLEGIWRRVIWIVSVGVVAIILGWRMRKDLKRTHDHQPPRQPSRA